MGKEFIIFGKNLEFEEEKSERNNLEIIREKAMEPFEGELEKTSEQIRFVGKINQYLGEQFEELGISEKPAVWPEQIHILPHEVFDRRFPKMKFEAIHSSRPAAIFIDASKRDRWQLNKSMLHESLHMASFGKYYFDSEEKNKKLKLKSYRSGYFLQERRGEAHSHFKGFNEAITDKIVKEIFATHRDEILEEFNVTPEEQRSVLYYNEYINILNVIIAGIAKKTNESEDLIWWKIKRGYFTGEMMHLREIEKIYGKNSLKVLAMLGGDATNDPREKKISRRILEYFQTADGKRREEISAEILNKKILP